MKLAKLLVRAALLRTSYTVLSMLIAFFMMPIFIHNLGDSWYGIWTIVSAFIGVYYIFDLGVTSAVSRYTSHAVGTEDSDELNRIINTGLVIFIILAVVVILATFVITFFSTIVVENPEYQSVIAQVILITGVSVALEFPFNAFAGLTEAKSRFDLLVYVRAFKLIVGAVINYYLLTKGVGIVGISIAAFIMARVSNLLYFYIARKNFPEMKIQLNLATKDHAKKLFKFSLWSFLISIASTLPFRANPIIIAAYISPAAVTIYVVGQRLVEYSNRFLNQATNILTPSFTQHFSRGEIDIIKTKFIFMVKANSIGALIAILGLIGLAEPLIVKWVGKEYLEGYGVVVIRIFGLMATFIFSNASNILYAINKHKFLAYLTIFEGITLVVMSILLIESYGILAVAIAATVPPLFTRFIILPLYVCDKINLNPFVLYFSVIKVVLVFAPVGGLFLYLSKYLLVPDGYLQILLYGVTLVVTLVVLAFFTQFTYEERQKLLSALPFVKRG